MAVATQAPPWSHVIIEQLAEAEVPETAAWAVVHVPPDGEGHPYIVDEGFSATQTGAVIVAEDFASSCGGGEVVTVNLQQLREAAEQQAELEGQEVLLDPTKPSWAQNGGSPPATSEEEPQPDPDPATAETAASEPEIVEEPEDAFETTGGDEEDAPLLEDDRAILAELNAEAEAIEAEQDALEQASVDLTNAVADIIEEAAAGTFGDERLQPAGQDPETGKLFDVPRVKVRVDTTDPTVLKLAFGGSIELDRTKADDVDLYNRILDGQDVELQVTAFASGAKKTHRRDGEGNVDAVVQTKSLVVHSIDSADES